MGCTADFSGPIVKGQAKLTITFDEFSIEKPRLAFILNVEDEIRLEMDLNAEISEAIRS